MLFLYILCVLSVWRITHMLQDEEGPFGVFSRLQAWAASKPDKVGGINHGFFCFYCLSMWVSIPFAGVLAINWLHFAVAWLALSAGAIWLDTFINSENNSK